MKKELRVSEIMSEKHIGYGSAERLFRSEICDKYGTNDFKLAESLFKTNFLNNWYHLQEENYDYRTTLSWMREERLRSLSR